jgi:Lipase (class 3)
MTISDKDLFMAILSMDSYNRGYGAGITLPETTGIGGASILTLSDLGISSATYSQWQTAGFYAAAYTTQWGTVISYRGTNFDGEPAANDVVNGWAFAAGDFTADQIDLSTQFLNSIAANSAALANITLTGHSLGGGLAGFVANDNHECERVAA